MTTEVTTRRTKLEKEINALIQTGDGIWTQVAKRLDEIRDKELWKPDFKTWKSYIHETWGRQTTWAKHLIQDYHTIKDLGIRGGHTGPPTQRTVRALSSVPKEIRAEVLQRVQEAQKPLNSVTVNHAAKDIKAAKCEDDMGTIIPKEILELWNRRGELQEVATLVSRAKCIVEEHRKREDPLFMKVRQDVIHVLEQVHFNVVRAIPYCVCGQCEGHPKDGCAPCHSTGFMSKDDYERLIPEKKREIRQKGIELRHEATRLSTRVP